MTLANLADVVFEVIPVWGWWPMGQGYDKTDREKAEEKIEAILTDWSLREQCLLYTLLHRNGVNLERAEQILRREGWWR